MKAAHSLVIPLDFLSQHNHSLLLEVAPLQARAVHPEDELGRLGGEEVRVRVVSDEAHEGLVGVLGESGSKARDGDHRRSNPGGWGMGGIDWLVELVAAFRP